MSMNDLHKAFELMEVNAEGGFFSGPKTEALINRAEIALGLVFPPTYREFLRRFGCGGVCGEEFYGLTRGGFENSSVPNAIWLTLNQRKDVQLPKSLVIVYEYGEGTDCAIDTSQRTTNGENPIVHWVGGLSSPDDKLEVVAEDFGQFLYKTIKEALSD